MTSLFKQDLTRLKNLAKKSWWLGFVLGLICHAVPVEYRVACRAVTDACSNLLP